MALVGPRPGLALALSVCVFAGTLASPAEEGHSASGSASEYQIKAAYIYYFATFISWPAAPAEPAPGDKTFVIGVLGDDPFGSILDDTVRGKTIRDCRFIVKRFRKAADALDSDILFISASEAEQIPQILDALDGAPVLTVSESDQFVKHGGQIGLRMEGRRVRFDINQAATERAGLKISSQLLKLGSFAPGRGDSGG